jgi:uncharacterized protein YegJ (DUF2314 family)
MRPLLLILSLAAAPLALAQTVSERATADAVFHMSQEEPALRQAFERAAQSLPRFLELATQPRPGSSRFALKVAISDGRSTEYLWVNAFSHSGDDFKGALNSTPRLVKGHKLGERIAFKREQIVDWAYSDEERGQSMGNFIACAQLSKEPPEQAASFKRELGLSCSD